MPPPCQPEPQTGIRASEQYGRSAANRPNRPEQPVFARCRSSGRGRSRQTFPYPKQPDAVCPASPLRPHVPAAGRVPAPVAPAIEPVRLHAAVPRCPDRNRRFQSAGARCSASSLYRIRRSSRALHLHEKLPRAESLRWAVRPARKTSSASPCRAPPGSRSPARL